MTYRVLAAAVLLASCADAQTLYVTPQYNFQITSGITYATKDTGKYVGVNGPAGPRTSDPKNPECVDHDFVADPTCPHALKLHFYEPVCNGNTCPPDNRPGIVWIHGGGFLGYWIPEEDLDYAEYLATVGYNVILPYYRTYDILPTWAEEYANLAIIAPGAEDSWEAGLWLMQQPSQHPDRIVLAGESAGAWIAMSPAYEDERILPNAGCTAASTPYGCCTDRDEGTCTRGNMACSAADTPYACCTGARVGTCPEPGVRAVINAFGALESGVLDRGDPPMWGIHGSADVSCWLCSPSKVSIIATNEVAGTLGPELDAVGITHDLRVVTPAPSGQPDGLHGAVSTNFLAGNRHCTGSGTPYACCTAVDTGTCEPTTLFTDFVTWLQTKIYPKKCCGGGS